MRPVKGTKALGNLSYEDWPREPGLFSPQELRRDLLALYSSLAGGNGLKLRRENQIKY